MDKQTDHLACSRMLTIFWGHSKTGLAASSGSTKYQTRWRTYLKEVWRSQEFFWFMPQIPPVSSKPSCIFRSWSVFTKISRSQCVNFKNWFPKSSFINLSHEAALHMFEMLILHDCACAFSALCVFFFYLENIRFPFHCVWQNIWFAVPHFESIVGDDWGAGLGHNLHILKHIVFDLKLMGRQRQRVSKMANSLNFGTDTFSTK